MIDLSKYSNGLDMNQFERIESISYHDYYIDKRQVDKRGSELLFAHNDVFDEDITEWYLMDGWNSYFLGISGIDNKLIRMTEQEFNGN